MATLTISERDRQEAEDFLQAYLSEMLPLGDYTPGSFLHDLVVKSVAYTVAYLRGESNLAKDRVSLARVQTMAAGTDRDEAADDLLSNWFLSRKSGRKSVGQVVVHVTATQDYTIPLGTRFYYDAGRVFVTSYTTPIVVPARDVVEVVGIDSVISDRYFTLEVVADSAGVGYDVTPATWQGWDAFSPYISRVESVASFVGGGDIESTDAFIARASDAICVRDLNSSRALRTTLKNNFTSVQDLYVAGAGTKELQRDLSPQSLSMTRFHTGGFADVYVKGTVVPAPVFSGTVGGSYEDPRPEVLNFVASDVADFTALSPPVTKGMVLQVTALSAVEPTRYVIDAVHPRFLAVEPRNPFPGERDGVEFSIGNIYPTFANVLTTRSTGSFTRSFALTRTVLLPEIPIYRVTKVTTTNGSGTLTYVRQPSLTAALSAREYRLYYADPQYAGSGYQLAYLELGTDALDGDTIHVEYETVAGFADVHSYVSDPFNRVACANIVAKAMFPVYLNFKLRYKLRDSTQTLDEAVVASALADYINTYPASDQLHVSKIASYVLSNWGTALAYAVPVSGSNDFAVAYDLYAPDGSVVSYESGGPITIDSDYETASPARLAHPEELGISANNVIYVTRADLITLEKE